MMSLNSKLKPRFANQSIKAEHIRGNKFYLIAKDFFEINNKYNCCTEEYEINWSIVTDEEKIFLIKSMLEHDDMALEVFEERMDYFINNPHNELGILFDLGKLTKQAHFDSFSKEILEIILESGNQVFAYELSETPRYEELKETMLLIDDVCIDDLMCRLARVFEVIGDEYTFEQKDYTNYFFKKSYA